MSSLPKPWARDGRLYDQDFKKLKPKLLSKSILFEDPFFPPNNTSIGRLYDVGDVAWVRPTKLWDRPELVIKGADRNDINQGDLGDCWFLCALAGLAESEPKVFGRVVLKDQVTKSTDSPLLPTPDLQEKELCWHLQVQILAAGHLGGGTKCWCVTLNP